MPDIIQQLEEGKKIQEENGIDTDSLRTKISSEEEKDKEKTKSKRGMKKKEEKDKEQKNKQQQKDESVPEDPFAQAEKIINESEEKDSDTNQQSNKEQKPEKYPGFDFNNFYEKGQKIFYIRVIEKLGIKEFLELKIRTIYPKMMVACEEKKATQCIGPDTKDMIFTDRFTALEVFNSIKVKSYKDVNIKDELGDTEVKDMED